MRGSRKISVRFTGLAASLGEILQIGCGFHGNCQESGVDGFVDSGEVIFLRGLWRDLAGVERLREAAAADYD
jgi:hypothetical protein